MRRDMDFCIKLLQDFSKGEFQSDFDLLNEADKFYMYQLDLLFDADLIEFDYLSFSGAKGIKYCPKLTWKGNDFLDLIENDTVWERSKVLAKSKGADLLKLPIDVIIAYGKMQAKQILGLEI